MSAMRLCAALGTACVRAVTICQGIGEGQMWLKIEGIQSMENHHATNERGCIL